MWCKAYGRKSQALGDPDAVDVVGHQLMACDRWAQAMGVEIAPACRIAEIGSGESLKERPSFSSILTELEETPPGSGYLFCSEVSRLTRADMEEAGRIVRILRESGVRPVIAGRPYDLTQPEEEYFFCLQALDSRRERQRYSWRRALKREQQFEESRIANGRVPWGYVWTKGAPSPEPDTEAFPLLVACCKEVLSEGLLTLSRRYSVRPDRLWTSLTSPMICGYPGQRYGRQGDYYVVLPRHQWRLPDRQSSAYPAACTREEWERIQAVLQERRKGHKKTTGADGWCRDVVWFEQCPGPAIISSIGARVKGGVQPARPVYERRGPAIREGDRWLPGVRFCYIERQPVHEAVQIALADLFATPDAPRVMVQNYIERQQSERQGNVVADRLADELVALRRRYQETVEAEFDSEEPLRSALHQRRLRLESEIRHLDQQWRQLLRRQDHQEEEFAALDKLVQAGQLFSEWWDTAPEVRRREFVNACIARVWCCYERSPGPGLRGRRWVDRVQLQPWFGGKAG